MQAKLTEFIDFMDTSYTSFHAVENIASLLKNQGFIQLKEQDSWNLDTNKKYYLKRRDSSLITIIPGSSPPEISGFKILAAHTDSPSFQVKQESICIKNNSVIVPLEVYGSPILSTWIDRDLIMAGRVSIIENDHIVNKTISLPQLPLIIPGIAIHLSTEKGGERNFIPGKNLNAVIPHLTESEFDLYKIIASEIDCLPEEILGMDLFLVSSEKARRSGLEKEWISSSRLDNLAMCHSITSAILDAKEFPQWTLGVFFNNEEIGSRTSQGAESNFLESVMERLVLENNTQKENLYRALSRSFLLSADGTHALNPLYLDRYDIENSPLMGNGPVIKFNTQYKYISDSESTAIMSLLAKENNINLQRFRTRADLPSGSTIGPLVASRLGLIGIDMGNSLWSMHSIRETMSSQDHLSMITLMKCFIQKSPLF